MSSLVTANLLSRKTRSAISCLAIGAGVMLLVVLAGMTRGTIGEIAERMLSADADMIVHARKSNVIFQRGGRLDERYAQKLMEVAGVEHATPVLLDRAVISSKAHNIYGIDPGDFTLVTRGGRISEGRLFGDGHEVVIDRRLAAVESLGAGDRVDCLGETFTVVGICETAMPVRLVTSKRALQEISHAEGRATFFFVKIRDGLDTTAVATSIETTLPTLSTLALDNYKRAIEENFKEMHYVIRGVSTVSALVSFLVIMLTMYTSVVERTREIGILKALGASRAHIVREVVLESLVVSCVGVVVGIALSVAAKVVIEMQWPLLTVELTHQWLLFGAGLGIAGGTLGALYPAIVAARRDAVTSLNYF